MKPDPSRISNLLVIAALLGSALFAPPSYAQEGYPTRPIRLIATFPPGGGSDFAARTIAQRLTGVYNQQVVVDNRPGADGTLGVQLLTRASADGYTWALTNNGALTISVHMRKNVQYHPVKDLTPITLVASYPFIIAARPALPANSVRDLIELAKKNPGKLNFASSGSISRVAQALFKSMANVEMVDVPFNGNGPTLTAVLGGEVDLMLASPTIPQLKTRALKALATTGITRSPALPDVPTVAESGVAGFDVTGWHAIIAPAQLARELQTRINRDITSVLRAPELQASFARAGLDVVASSPAELAAKIEKDMAMWAKVVPALN